MVYKKIIQYCKKNKITVTELEKKCGLGNGVIGKWKAGSEPSLSSLKKIEKVTGIAMADLIKT